MVRRWGEDSRAWRALAASVVTIVLASGSRTSLAAFIKPIESDLGLERSVLSTAGALTVLTYGLAQPLVGIVATRFGARQVMIGGVILSALGGFGVATASTPVALYVFAGILPGLAFAAASSVPATALLAGWFVGRLGLATGVMSAAIPAGQSVFVPLATALIVELGWRQTYIVLGLAVLLIGLPTLALLVAEPGTVSRAAPSTAARVGRDIWLVGLGYFACGFSDQFISLHLVPLVADRGLDPLAAAGWLSLLLLIGIAGSVASGPLADRISPKYMLSGLYLARMLALPLLLLSAPAALALFALIFGVTYIANQAPGARLVRDRYGVRAIGRLMGGVGLAHQVGGAIGVALGGYSVAEYGTYTPAIVVVMLVVLVGGLIQLAIPRGALLHGS